MVKHLIESVQCVDVKTDVRPSFPIILLLIIFRISDLNQPRLEVLS